MICIGDIEENDPNDTTACDDDTHKDVPCTHSYVFWIRMVSFKNDKGEKIEV